MSNYSYHIFLFPFKWELQTSKEADKALFSDLANLEKADELVLSDPRWATDLYNKFNEPEDYNEFIYFYPFVRDALYDYKEELDRNVLIRHYEFKPTASKTMKYIINIKDEGKYELDVKYILLNLYKTGVGLLSFHLNNDKSDQLKWEDILKINEYGRRLYPQFLSDNFSAEVIKSKFLADSIEVSHVNAPLSDNFIITEDFEFATGISTNIGGIQPCRLDIIPNHIEKILPQPFLQNIQHKVQPLIDDRMFVVSSFLDGDDVYSKEIRELKKGVNGNLVSPFNKRLYEYIFIDGPDSSGVGNDEFRDDLLTRHTYARWIGEATFFGLSRYSFVSYSNFFLIPIHTRTMYYKMAELCLVQRASVLNFTEEISRISKLKEGTSILTSKLNDLYKNYIQFVNKMSFREVTAQEQGIELYNMLQEKMSLRNEVENLDKQLGELHSYVMLLEEKERNAQLENINHQSHSISRNTYKLSLYGIPLLIMSIIIGILSMQLWDKNNFPIHNFNQYQLAIPQILWIGITVILPGFITFLIIYFLNKRAK